MHRLLRSNGASPPVPPRRLLRVRELRRLRLPAPPCAQPIARQPRPARAELSTSASACDIALFRRDTLRQLLLFIRHDRDELLLRPLQLIADTLPFGELLAQFFDVLAGRCEGPFGVLKLGAEGGVTRRRPVAAIHHDHRGDDTYYGADGCR